MLIGLSLLIAVRADAGALISVDASLPSIPADGKTACQILVTVLNETGTPASDGTEVRLTTSAGDITPVVYTSGGRAVGILTSTTIPQIATIVANANGSSGSGQVEFSSSDYAGAPASARAIRMSGGALAYSVDADTVIGSNNVTMEYRGLTIQAASIQVCQITGQIRAQGDVTIEKDDQTVTADEFACDTRSERIRLRDLKDSSTMRTLDISKLAPSGPQDTKADADLFRPLMTEGGRTWITAKRMVLIPGDKILFFKASVYVGDSKVIAMPLYSYSYETRQSILQQVRYDPYAGMLVDLPFYYRLADSGIGALKLRYAANGTDIGGFARPRKGVSFGLEQGYSAGDRSQGRLFVDSILSPSQAFEMMHHIEYGSAMTGGRAELSARFQPSSSYAKNVFSSTLNIMGNMRNYNYSVFGYMGGSDYEQRDYLNPEVVRYVNQSTSSVRAVIRPNAPMQSRRFGPLSPSLTLGYGTLWTSGGGPVPNALYQSLGLSLNRGKPLGGNAVLNFGGSVAFTATTRGATGSSLRVGPTVSTNWTGGGASLGYTLNLQHGTTDTGFALSTHQLNGSLFLNSGGKWNSFTSVDYGLDSRRLSLMSSLGYNFDRNWSLRSSYNLYRYAYEMEGQPFSFSTSYLKVGVYRPVGPYEVGLAWSPQGQNFGLDKNKRIWLELSGLGF